MGNYRFRLSDMIPNAWFYKLKYMASRPGTHYKTTSTTKNKHTSSSSSSWSKSSLSISSSSSLAAAPNHDRPKTAKQLPHLCDQRKSYYFTRDLNFHHDSPGKNPINPADKLLIPTESPRKSSSSRRRRSTKRNRLVSSSTISAGCSCRATLGSVWSTKPPTDSTPYSRDSESLSEHGSILPECGSDIVSQKSNPESLDGNGRLSNWSNSSCKCRINSMDDDQKQSNAECDRVRNLPPIITKKHEQYSSSAKVQRTSAEFTERDAYRSLSVKVVKEEILSTRCSNDQDDRQKSTTAKSPVVRRRLSANSGWKLRTNSPRIANLRSTSQLGRRSTSGTWGSVSESSFAVVKSSKDPRRDFKESMEEMIVESNIRASKDMEELLACYLILNSDEYHDLIIDVFKQIWLDFIHVK